MLVWLLERAQPAPQPTQKDWKTDMKQLLLFVLFGIAKTPPSSLLFV